MIETTVPPTRGVLTECVRLATAAPSLHNSQPWLFRIRGYGIDVYADTTRRLAVLDPTGREQLISVGAAVFTLRLALRQAGFRSDVTHFPLPSRTDLVARVRVTQSAELTPAVEALAAAIPHRHTNRSPFARTPAPPEAVHRLRDAAHREGSFLARANPAARDLILGMARSADDRLRSRPGYRDELARWTARRIRHDGIPVWAGGPADALDLMPSRDFAELSPVPRPREPFEPEPTILVLTTVGDRRSDWVRAGQALQRVLLTATWEGLATMPISQPVEVPAARRLLIDPTAGLSAQMVLRVGYGRTAEPTPRRPLAEVLLPRPVGPDGPTRRGARTGSVRV